MSLRVLSTWFPYLQWFITLTLNPTPPQVLFDCWRDPPHNLRHHRCSQHPQLPGPQSLVSTTPSCLNTTIFLPNLHTSPMPAVPPSQRAPAC